MSEHIVKYRLLNFPKIDENIGYQITQYYFDFHYSECRKIIGNVFPEFTNKYSHYQIQELRYRIKTKNNQTCYELTCKYNFNEEIEIQLDHDIYDLLKPFILFNPVTKHRICRVVLHNHLPYFLEIDIFKGKLTGLVLLESEIDTQEIELEDFRKIINQQYKTKCIESDNRYKNIALSAIEGLKELDD